MSTKKRENNKKLTAFPAVLRQSHELSRDKIDDIEGIIDKTEEPGQKYSAAKDKSWTLNSDRIVLNSTDKPTLKVQFVNQLSLSELLKQALIQGGSEGFFATMMLFQYYWNQRKLGKTIEKLDPQHVINSVLGDRSYKLNPTDKDRFCNIFKNLSGIEIFHYNKRKTAAERKDKKISNDDVYYDRYVLFSYGGLLRNEKSKKVIHLENVKFMEGLFSENMTAEEYKRISRIFIPQEDILKLSSDKNSKSKAVFLNLVCLDLSNIAQYNKSYKDYDFETCVKYAQWSTPKSQKTRIWNRIIKILDEAKENGLLDYDLLYKEGKEGQKRFLQFVRIHRNFSVNPSNLTFNFVPEQLDIKTPSSESSLSQF